MENAVKFTELKRFSGLEYANWYGYKDKDSFGKMQRTDAAVSADNSTILIWKRNWAGENEFSGFDFNRFNDILDGKVCGKYTSFNFKNISPQTAGLKFSFCDKNNQNLGIPNSIQGLEISNKGSNGLYSIYISSGNEGLNKGKEHDHDNVIYRFNSAGAYRSKKTIKRGNVSSAPMEIEGIHIMSGGRLSFLLVESMYENNKPRKLEDVDKTEQYIMSINKDYLK